MTLTTGYLMDILKVHATLQYHSAAINCLREAICHVNLGVLLLRICNAVLLK